MRIEHRLVGDVYVIDLNGKLVEVLPEVQSIIDSAIESGVKKIVLNIEYVAYINSSGLGELVKWKARTARSGARLVLCNSREKVRDLLTVTKLRVVFDIYSSVEEALRSFADGTRLEVTCPCLGSEGWIPFSPLSEYQQCPLCGMELKVSAPVVVRPSVVAAQITAFRVPTYDGERISISIGEPTLVSIDGRLDLFAAEAIEQGVRLLATPRTLVFSLCTNDVSEAGMAALARLCEADAGSRAAISLNSGRFSENHRWKAAYAALTYDNEEHAIQAIEPVMPPHSLNASVRRSVI